MPVFWLKVSKRLYFKKNSSIWGYFQFIFKDKERDFLMRLRSSLQHVLLYEDPDLQQRACDKIPLSELMTKAKEASERTKQGGEAGVDERDCLILELLSWFKGTVIQLCVYVYLC